MLKSKQKVETLIVYRTMRPISQERLQRTYVNIILTPQFYLLKKEELPVKYLYQAKRIAPSLFDDEKSITPTTRYFVFRCGEKWCFIAYDNQEIMTFLKQKGIDLHRINKVYFAEQFTDAFLAPMLLDIRTALATINDTVVVLPPRLAGIRSPKQDEQQRIFLFPKHGVSIETVQPHTKRAYVTAAAALFVLAGMWFFEGTAYRQADKPYVETLRQLTERYPALASRYTRQNIIEKYQKIDGIERKKRETLQTLTRLVFRGVTLKKLTFEAKGFEAYLQADRSDTKTKLMRLASEEGFQTAIRNGNVVLQGAWK